MPILLRSVPLGLDEPEEHLLERAAALLGVPVGAIRAHAIVRRALDARKTAVNRKFGGVHLDYQLELALDEPPTRERRILKRLRPQQAVWIAPSSPALPEPGREPLPSRPIIVGFGPAGMFAALRLAQMGFEPLVIERGRAVRRRHRDVMQRFYRQGDFDPNSNLLFGEGGAGTYSDGKLYTRIGDPLCREVLETFYHHGADPDILIDARPHIGSDRLPTVCTRIRRRIESWGGTVDFDSTLEDVRIEDGVLTALCINGRWRRAGPTLLALGHSARDTVRMLARRGVRIEAKPFQLGVRVEHPQALVDRWQYGPFAGHARLGPAEYHCVARAAGCRGGDVFSFCMCPGGMILPTNESAGLIATNGASKANRSGAYANCGLVLTIDPAGMGMGPLDALDYVETIERLAFEATGGSYAVPCQRAPDFLAGRSSTEPIETSYPLGSRCAALRTILPEFLADSLAQALPILERKMPGFVGGEAVITAPETRASAPVRITRAPATRQALGIDGLYPVGEGAGYAGGIVSAAVDGIKSADVLIRRFARPRSA